jgi:5-methylcytosine-specific restriction endonuclease McrA
MNCIECGAGVPPRVKARCGKPPGFCSAECRRRRKRTTYQQWMKTNRDRKLALDAKCRAQRKETHPDYFRQHYAKHREKRKREAGEWYHANSERALEVRRAYVAANIEKARIWGRKSANKRWAIKKNLFVEDVDPLVVFERDKAICGICRKLVDVNSNWELDHIVPLSKQGPHSYANIQLAHRRCNRSKGAKVG